jgi:hypothetical protein
MSADEMPQGVDERKLVRKLDVHLIPLIMCLYLFSFLDRYSQPPFSKTMPAAEL